MAKTSDLESMTETQNCKYYESMLTLRAFESLLATAADQGHSPGLLHLGLGLEALCVAITASLDNKIDFVTSSHRGHVHALSMGADRLAVAKEILGRAGGLSQGLGGTQHLISPESGFLTSNGIVGAQVPLALGAAITNKNRGNQGVAVAFFGDGAANQGAVLESMNMAASLSLPMIFVLENNGLGEFTGSDYAMGGDCFTDRARTFGLKAMKIDGTDFLGMRDIIPAFVDDVRKGVSGPIFIEATVERLTGHYHGDKEVYRENKPDNGIGGIHDPLVVMREILLANGVGQERLKGIEDNVWKVVKAEMDEAIKAPAPDPIHLNKFTIDLQVTL